MSRLAVASRSGGCLMLVQKQSLRLVLAAFGWIVGCGGSDELGDVDGTEVVVRLPPRGEPAMTREGGVRGTAAQRVVLRLQRHEVG